jgi:membrane protease YdiL (CAAX protease family)
MLLLVIGMGCMYLGNFTGTEVMQILSYIMDYDYANILNVKIEQSPLWATFPVICIGAPLGEELIFRKLILDRTRAYGDLPSILLSGFLFALFHGNLFQFFYAFLLGMILAYTYTRSGSYLWCVAMHAAFNFLGSIALPELASLLPTDPEAVLTVGQGILAQFLTAWVYGLIIAAVVLVCTLWHKRKLSKGTLQTSDGRTLGCMLGNPGMIACVTVMLVILITNLIPLRA